MAEFECERCGPASWAREMLHGVHVLCERLGDIMDRLNDILDKLNDIHEELRAH